jgi:hypothetical protein
LILALEFFYSAPLEVYVGAMMGHGRIKFVVFFALGVILCAGFYQVHFSFNQCTSPKLTLDAIYQNAIDDAMVAKPSEVCTNLTAIVERNHNLNWTGTPGNQSVLVVTFTKYASSYPVGETINTTWGETWVTVAPELKAFFKTHVDADVNVTLRTLQLLGLPPNNTNSFFVEMWINPQALFRPTPDNEINDTSAQLAFPASATDDYKAWFNSNIIYSYFPERYPWTRLGYTYDWGSAGSHFGLSEFVIIQNSLATVESVTPLTDYVEG